MASLPLRSTSVLKAARHSRSGSSAKIWARSAGCCFCSRFRRLGVAPMRRSRRTDSRMRSILRCAAMALLNEQVLVTRSARQSRSLSPVETHLAEEPVVVAPVLADFHVQLEMDAAVEHGFQITAGLGPDA